MANSINRRLVALFRSATACIAGMSSHSCALTFAKKRMCFYIITLLLLITANSSFAQTTSDLQVCAGTKAMYATTGGGVGSTYEYEIVQPEAGEIVQAFNDSIVIKWGEKNGIFQIRVRETSKFGCESNDWAYLNVEIVGDIPKFPQQQFSFCGNDGVRVEFNRNDFRAYEWVDKSVPENGYITKPGRYELRTIDQHGCRLSTFVDVAQIQMPTVSLPHDTMVCTPGFTLNPRNTQNNPDGTVYTWTADKNNPDDNLGGGYFKLAGGESSASRTLTIEDHDIEQDYKYWLTAEYNGCSVTDSIVVSACAINPWFDIPNTFTPNEDGDNDTWEIDMLQDYPEAIVEVFDRWGRIVFRSAKGYPIPWDGRDTNGRYLPMEAYYYIINLNDGQTRMPIAGTITIIR